jgi:glycosyltransferase involved in cell wall biosynthesis
VSEIARPRLLHLTVGLGVGGAEEIVRGSLPRIREEGFEVTLGCLKPGGSLLREIQQGGIPVRSLGGDPPWNPGLLWRLLSWIRSGRFDIIHSHLYWANLAVRMAAPWAGRAVIINSHHGTDAWLSSSRRWMERSTAPMADRVVTCSEAVRRRLLEIGLPAEKVVTVPNGVEAGRFSDASPRDSLRDSLGILPRQMVVGTVGRLDEPVKGLGTLVEAMRGVVGRIPEAVCLVVGDGPSRASLENSVKERSLAGSIRFLGERRDVPDLLQALDLYVQPSLLEGFGLSALEAMASGKAVVASRAGGLPEVVVEGETGVLVPPGDAESLSRAILDLLEDPGRRSRLGEQGLARARQEFPMERMIQGWTGIYRELLARKGWREAA